MIDLGMTPERLPTDPEAAIPGRFAPKRKKTKEGKPADKDGLLQSGVFIPDTDEKES